MKDLKVIGNKENHLMKRREVVIQMHSEIVPSKKESLEIMAKETSSDPEHIEIKSIKGKFGSKNFLVTAHIYGNKQDKELTEPKKKKVEAKA